MGHLPKFLTFILILARFTDGQSLLFWGRNDKKLEKAPMQMIKINTFNECLGICQADKRCKAFNFNYNIMMCELLEVNRCEQELMLVDNKGISYFDMIADGHCLSSKYLSSKYYLYPITPHRGAPHLRTYAPLSG